MVDVTGYLHGRARDRKSPRISKRTVEDDIRSSIKTSQMRSEQIRKSKGKYYAPGLARITLKEIDI